MCLQIITWLLHYCAHTQLCMCVWVGGLWFNGTSSCLLQKMKPVWWNMTTRGHWNSGQIQYNSDHCIWLTADLSIPVKFTNVMSHCQGLIGEINYRLHVAQLSSVFHCIIPYVLSIFHNLQNSQRFFCVCCQNIFQPLEKLLNTAPFPEKLKWSWLLWSGGFWHFQTWHEKVHSRGYGAAGFHLGCYLCLHGGYLLAVLIDATYTPGICTHAQNGAGISFWSFHSPPFSGPHSCVSTKSEP